MPNANAIIVLVRMMTLYGMLKSGVGRESRRLPVRKVYLMPPLGSSTVTTAGL